MSDKGPEGKKKWKTQIKTTQRNNFSPMRLAKIKKYMITYSVGKAMGK